MAGGTYESLINFPMFGSFEGSGLRLNALWKTDWDFESQIPTAELEWTPYNGKLGLGSYNTKLDALWWRLEPVLHADFGHVLEDGDWVKSQENDTFAHVGPKITANLIPLPLISIFLTNPLLFTVSYSQYVALTSESNEARAFTAEVSWFIRKPGSGAIGPIDPGIALTLSYRDYDDVENQQDDDSLIIGISVGF